MPELPDLQVFSRNLTRALAGKKLTHLIVSVTKKLKTPVAELQQELEGKKLEEVFRQGKTLNFRFGKKTVLNMHLMLHGKLFLFENENPNKHTIATLIFKDGTGLALTDYQKAASLTLNPEENDAPDALTVTKAYLKEQLAKKRTNIKNVLLDQHIIQGIGNAYADDILWEARISPFSIAGKIPDNKVAALAAAIPRVLQQAEKKILKSHPDIIAGEVRDYMLVHSAKKDRSPDGAPILHKSGSGRKTYYTVEQEVFE